MTLNFTSNFARGNFNPTLKKMTFIFLSFKNILMDQNYDIHISKILLDTHFTCKIPTCKV